MSKNSLRLWIIGSIFLAIGVAPFLAQGDQATVQRVEENRQAISHMTQSERDRLDRNFAAYQKMPAEKRTELRNFHQKIEEDRTSNTGELDAALQQYDEWLATIEPFQRDQLKAAKNPQKRLKLMSEIVKEQRARNVTSVIRRRIENSPLANVPVLDETQLLSLLEKIEEFEHRKLTLPQQSELNRKEGISRFLYLLEKLKENARSRPQERVKAPPWVVREFLVTFKIVESRLDQLIQQNEQNKAVRNYILKDSSEVSTPLRIQAVILKSMLFQVVEQQDQASIPPQQQLEQLFSSLPEEEQDELLQLEAIDFYKELLARSEPSNPEEKNVSQYDVMKIFFGGRDDQRHRPSEKRPPPSSNGERPPNGRDDRPDDREFNGFRGQRRPGERGPNGRFRNGSPEDREERKQN